MIIIAIVVFVVFASITLFWFHRVSNDPIDTIAIPYIREDLELQQQYGDILSVGRNVIHSTESTDTSMCVPYGVETKAGRVIVYVTLNKEAEQWNAVSLEIVEY